MDNRAHTQTGQIVVVEEAKADSPSLRWFLWGALTTLPIHGLIALLFWSLT